MCRARPSTPSPHPAHGAGEPALGRGAHSRRAARARDPSQQAHHPEIHAQRAAIAPVRADLGAVPANHANEIWACDFLQTYDALLRAIFVFVIVAHGSRRVVHLGVTRSPTSAWVTQQHREATAWAQGLRFLIRDNDDKFGTRFDDVATGTAIKILRTPYRAFVRMRSVSASLARSDANVTSSSSERTTSSA